MRKLRTALGFIAFVAGVVHANLLAPTPLQGNFIRAIESFEKFRTTAPDLAAILNGKPVQPDAIQKEFFQIPIGDSAAMAFGNTALAMWNEKQGPGKGKPWIGQSVSYGHDQIGVLWLLTLLQLQNGTAQGFSNQAQGLEAVMLERGWTRLPEAASWLMVSAQDLQTAGDLERSDMARSVASRLDPVSPVPEVSMAINEFRSFRWVSGYNHFDEAYHRLVAYPENQQVVVFNGLRLLRYALALSCLLLLLSWVVRYWPFIVHEHAERLPRDTNLYLRYGVIALVPVALLVAGLGLLSMCFLASFLLWKRAKSYERSLIAAILLFVGLQPWIAGMESVISSRFDSAGAESMYQRVLNEGYTPELSARIQKISERSTTAERPLLEVAQSILARKEGKYEKAVELARTARIHPSEDTRSLVNLANSMALISRLDTATRLYRQALGNDWGNGPLLYDLGQSIASRGRTDSMSTLIGNASPSARYRINVVGDQNTRAFQALPPNRSVMDPELSPTQMWTKIGEEYLARNWTVDRWDLQTGLVDVPPMALLPTVGCFLVFLFWWGGRVEKRKVLFECRTCGRVMCRHCRKGIHCSNCFRRLSGIEEVDLRNQLLERIERESNGRRRILRLAMDLALPGTGRLMATPSIGAFFQVFVLGACLAYSLNLPNFITAYPTNETLVGQSVSAGILVFLYALGALQLIRGLGGDATTALKET